MKKFLFTVFVLLFAAVGLSAQDLRISVKAENPLCIYKAGETARFYVQVLDSENKPVAGKTVEFQITGENGAKPRSGKIISTAGPEKLEMRLDKPGFLRAKLFFPENRKPAKVVELGAGFDPEKITQGGSEPADFDEFWAKELAAIKARLGKAKITCTEFDAPDKFKGQVRCFDLRIDDGVLCATGFMAMPADAKAGKHPLIMCFNGASKIGADLKGILNQAKAYKAIVFNMNIHDTKNLVTRKETLMMRRDPKIYKYFHRDADSIEKYGVGIVFRRVLMCREYLKTRPEWDGETIIARGGSMGGAQTVVASAGEPKMKLCLAGAPAMCDHQGFLKQMTSGWPALFQQPLYKTGGEKHEAAMKTMPYFDVVNFAKRVKCKAIITVGLIDYVCPPSSVYAAYNALGTADKCIYIVPRGNHGLNLDPESKAPGVFSYGGSDVQKIATRAYRAAMKKQSAK